MARDLQKWKETKRRWYLKNKARIIPAVKELRKQNRAKVSNWVKEYKRTLKCSCCPENHPACLQFHHRDPKDKKFAISEAVVLAVSICDILEEISKCDVLCANCHAKHHYYRQLA